MSEETIAPSYHEEEDECQDEQQREKAEAGELDPLGESFALLVRNPNEPWQQVGRPSLFDLLDELTPGPHVAGVESAQRSAPLVGRFVDPIVVARRAVLVRAEQLDEEIGRASCRERV